MVGPDAPGSAIIQQMMDTGSARILDVDADVIAFMDQAGLEYADIVVGTLFCLIVLEAARRTMGRSRCRYHKPHPNISFTSVTGHSLIPTV